MKKTRSMVIFLMVWVFCALLLTGCPPSPPCDQKIDNPDVFENITRTNPIFQQIVEGLEIKTINIAPCVVNDRVSITVQVVLPPDYSTYGIRYTDYLSLTYNVKTQSLAQQHQDGQFSDLDKSILLEPIKAKIDKMESDPRVREVVLKTQPDPLNNFSSLISSEIFRLNNRIQYDQNSGRVTGYLLSNNMDWQEFPEISLAHKAVETDLLVGDLSTCKIGRSEMHNYTEAKLLLDSKDQPWFMTVALICDDGWKDAVVEIQNDGSYSNVRVSQEY